MIDVLVVGGGGREYELVRQMASSPRVCKIYVAPGNAGTAEVSKSENVDLSASDVDAIVKFAQRRKINVAMIGPEAPLVAGLADALRAVKVAVFGPSLQAARLEASKAFASEFMQRHNIPQPACLIVHSLPEALIAIKGKDPDSYVLKADGLAGGKGVVLPKSTDEAEQTLAAMLSGDGFEGAGKKGVVIQERLHGPEVSAFAVTDGTDFVLLPFSQDHKRLNDHDEGPNTGGVGAYSPLPETIVSADAKDKVHDIATRTIKGMTDEGTPYQGVLFIGLMLAEERGGDPVVIEYNVRFGDPETEVVLSCLSESGCDVPGMLLATAFGQIGKIKLPERITKTTLTVCLTASGYPENPYKGDVIEGLKQTYEGVIIHQAGTRREGSHVVTSGGRALYVTGFGTTADEAAKRAYGAIGNNGIHFAGMHYRHDIGWQVRSSI